MIFSRLFFLYLFFPICFLCYFATKKNAYRNTVLIVFSLLFYAWGEPSFLWLLVLSALVNYLFGRLLERFRDKGAGKLFLALALILNLGVLIGFKYTGFVLENINAAFSLSIPIPDLPLPLGISFYTFRIVSYLIDCAWGKVRAERNFFSFLLYVSLFPITVSGPIVRYETIQKELHGRTVTANDLSDGLGRIAAGLGKKVILADNLGVIVEQFLGNNIASQTTLGTWYGVVLYALQMYFDFSGYSDMAIGISRIFGFHLEENFRHPFLCRDITEFWQRWHISLGTFFRDYLLYVPIFGKRRKFADSFWFGSARTLARCQLELHHLGTVLRRFHFHRNLYRQETHEENSSSDSPCAEQANYCHRIRHLLLHRQYLPSGQPVPRYGGTKRKGTV